MYLCVFVLVFQVRPQTSNSDSSSSVVCIHRDNSSLSQRLLIFSISVSGGIWSWRISSQQHHTMYEEYTNFLHLLDKATTNSSFHCKIICQLFSQWLRWCSYNVLEVQQGCTDLIFSIQTFYFHLFPFIIFIVTFILLLPLWPFYIFTFT